MADGASWQMQVGNDLWSLHERLLKVEGEMQEMKDAPQTTPVTGISFFDVGDIGGREKWPIPASKMRVEPSASVMELLIARHSREAEARLRDVMFKALDGIVDAIESKYDKLLSKMLDLKMSFLFSPMPVIEPSMEDSPADGSAASQRSLVSIQEAEAEEVPEVGRTSASGASASGGGSQKTGDKKLAGPSASVKKHMTLAPQPTPTRATTMAPVVAPLRAKTPPTMKLRLRPGAKTMPMRPRPPSCPPPLGAPLPSQDAVFAASRGRRRMRSRSRRRRDTAELREDIDRAAEAAGIHRAR